MSNKETREPKRLHHTSRKRVADTPPSPPSHDIAVFAYALWVARGCCN